MRRFLPAVLIATAALPALCQDLSISAERIRQHTRFLSSDLLEGRGVGVRGGDLATEYLATEFALAGAKPAGDNGTYFQKTPLVGVETQPNAQLSAAAGDKTLNFSWRDDFVGLSQRQTPETRFQGEAIFVGHGIAAPEWKWDDFKGVDVKGKILVLFTNEPASSDPNFFGGRALTYYGRWSYKYEEAVRRGAAGAIIIHTTPTAGYGWEVVRNSWAREEPYVKLAPGEYSLGFQGWVTREAGEKLLALSGHTVDELLAAAEKRDFRPIPLGVQIQGSMPAKVRALDTRNVAAIIPGSDPQAEGRGSGLQRSLGSSGHWHAGEGGTPSTTAPSTMPPAAPFCWNWRACGRPSHRSLSAARCSSPSRPKRAACAARSTTPRILCTRFRRPPSI